MENYSKCSLVPNTRRLSFDSLSFSLSSLSLSLSFSRSGLVLQNLQHVPMRDSNLPHFQLSAECWGKCPWLVSYGKNVLVACIGRLWKLRDKQAVHFHSLLSEEWKPYFSPKNFLRFLKKIIPLYFLMSETKKCVFCIFVFIYKKLKNNRSKAFLSDARPADKCQWNALNVAVLAWRFISCDFNRQQIDRSQTSQFHSQSQSRSTSAKYTCSGFSHVGRPKKSGSLTCSHPSPSASLIQHNLESHWRGLALNPTSTSLGWFEPKTFAGRVWRLLVARLSLMRFGMFSNVLGGM